MNKNQIMKFEGKTCRIIIFDDLGYVRHAYVKIHGVEDNNVVFIENSRPHRIKCRYIRSIEVI